jgi:hypothetical protein
MSSPVADELSGCWMFEIQTHVVQRKPFELSAHRLTICPLKALS